MPVTYHPKRADIVDRLRMVRENLTTGRLQKNLLSGLEAGEVDLDALLETSHVLDGYLSEEGFDADAKLPWRKEIQETVSKARAGFTQAGRNIFDMALISPMFRRVDVDAVEIGDTPMPYPSFYLHFGEGCGLALANGLSIEGSYVVSTAGKDANLQLTFVCTHPDHGRADSMPLGETFKRITAAATCTLRRGVPVGESLTSLGFQGDPDLISSGEILAQAVRMAVNGLLYLSTPKADVEFGYATEAPEKLVRKALGQVPGEPERARISLENQGYIRVNFCGRRTLDPAAWRREPGTPEPHWRRGHWRRVVLGAGRLQREWRLFPPTIVNSHLGQPKAGKIYAVRPPNA